MKIRKPKRLSLVEQVTKQIEDLIHQNYWQVGEKLPPEKELMEQFEVSRNTLREAIRALVHVGLLETKQGSGTIVLSSSVIGAVLTKHIEQRSLLHILEVRIALESEAASLAAERRTEDHLAKMESNLRACEEAFKKNDLDAYLTADVNFHQAIVEASENGLLIDLYSTFSDSLYYSVEQNISDLQKNRDEQKIHEQLFHAIKEQQATKANDIVRSYLLKRKALLV